MVIGISAIMVLLYTGLSYPSMKRRCKRRRQRRIAWHTWRIRRHERRLRKYEDNSFNGDILFTR